MSFKPFGIAMAAITIAGMFTLARLIRVEDMGGC